jgi:hypothetical protein
MMTRPYRLLLFYALVLLAAFDMSAIIQRLFIPAPDPIAWEKVVVAGTLQVVTGLLGGWYLHYLSGRRGRPLVGTGALSIAMTVRLAPVVALGLVTALSVQLLFNAFNCGNHYFPTHRGASVCPR